MVYNVIHSDLAKLTFFENIKYLEENWSKQVILNFLRKVNKITKLIKNNPKIFPIWNEKKNIRKVIIISQITMFYIVQEKTIDVVLFWNNYQNPKKLKELIRNS